ncbi:hypothetical protein PV10_02103 [Exophiala mesophila]|uniref:Uncharacterized protein n=1 Tax=Exophiala mesophila TaxID=212818 RepID=A0A0D1ZK76_EXOME|nr:uncharacterized protein PV10_02103 [Exophiala mesophila]KIV94329.1 hypothetical protein PV10_02103 [Exophiala mesophila]
MSAEVAPKKRGRPKKVAPAVPQQGKNKNSLVEEATPVAPSSSKSKSRTVTAKAAIGGKKASSSSSTSASASKTPTGVGDDAPTVDSVAEVKPSVAPKKKTSKATAQPVDADASEKLANVEVPLQENLSRDQTPTHPVSEILKRADAFVRDSKVLNQDFSDLVQSRENEHARLQKQADLQNEISQQENHTDGIFPSSASSTPAQVPGSVLPQSTSPPEPKLNSPSYPAHTQPSNPMSFYQPPIDLTYRPKYALPYSTTTALKARTASQSQRPNLRAAPPPPQSQPANSGERLPPKPSEMSASQLERDSRYRSQARSLKSKYLTVVLALPIMIASSWFLLKKVHEEREYRAGRLPGSGNDVSTGVVQLREGTQVKQLEQDLARTVGPLDEKTKALEGRAAVVKDEAIGASERQQSPAPVSVSALSPAPVQSEKKRLLEE